MTQARVALGAPGIYSIPVEPVRALTAERMDVCAFVGVAPRGPARPPRFDADWATQPCDEPRGFPRSVAVAVESFDAYRRLFGAFEGPGLLPYAIASFFEQGGRRAYVVRIVHQYRTPNGELDDVANAKGRAEATLPLTTEGGTPIVLRARDEGNWGNSLKAALSFTTRPLHVEEARLSELLLPRDVDLPAGALLRFTLAGGVQVLRFVTDVREEWHVESPRKRRLAALDLALGAPADRIELVEGSLHVDDGDQRSETHEGLGLSASHPRWLAKVLYAESILLHPDAGWIDDEVKLPDARLPDVVAPPFAYGEDRYRDIVPDDFFDDRWTLGDECPGAGIHALVDLSDLGMLAVPDLYSPRPLDPADLSTPVDSLAGDTFERCVVVKPTTLGRARPELEGLQLDPELPEDLAAITALQQRVVALADDLRAFVVLLDVPPRLHQRSILRWRSAFGSAFAASYHPWLRVSRLDDARDAAIWVPPSAVAAGIIAQREIALGVPYGPANVLAAGVVDVVDRVSPARHDELHPLGINVFLPERDGIRLSAARTLARDAAYRQLSVRRLMTMLERALDHQMQWAAFEPNNATLRADVKQMIRTFLRQLFRANAFRGASEDEAFFVRCDDDLNPPRVVDQGRLIVEIGVAPAEPLEFLVLRIERGGDGTLSVAS